jgi:hypothetical protein
LDLFLDTFPFGQGVQREAMNLRVDCNNDGALAMDQKRLAMLGWYRQSPLRIHIDVMHASKHSIPALFLSINPQKTRFTHFSPLCDTIEVKEGRCQAGDLAKNSVISVN